MDDSEAKEIRPPTYDFNYRRDRRDGLRELARALASGFAVVIAIASLIDLYGYVIHDPGSYRPVATAYAAWMFGGIGLIWLIGDAARWFHRRQLVEGRRWPNRSSEKVRAELARQFEKKAQWIARDLNGFVRDRASGCSYLRDSECDARVRDELRAAILSAELLRTEERERQINQWSSLVRRRAMEILHEEGND
jgi:hypothetical protein